MPTPKQDAARFVANAERVVATDPVTARAWLYDARQLARAHYPSKWARDVLSEVAFLTVQANKEMRDLTQWEAERNRRRNPPKRTALSRAGAQKHPHRPRNPRMPRQNPIAKIPKKQQFQPGDVVRYTTAFLRNTGMFTSNRMNGLVVAVTPNTGKWGSGFPSVIWNDDPNGEPQRVNWANLELDPRARGERVPIPSRYRSNPTRRNGATAISTTDARTMLKRASARKRAALVGRGKKLSLKWGQRVHYKGKRYAIVDYDADANMPEGVALILLGATRGNQVLVTGVSTRDVHAYHPEHSDYRGRGNPFKRRRNGALAWLRVETPKRMEYRAVQIMRAHGGTQVKVYGAAVEGAFPSVKDARAAKNAMPGFRSYLTETL